MRQHIYRPVVGYDHSDLKLDDILLYGDNSSDLEVNTDDMLLRRIYVSVCMLSGYDQYKIREDIADLLIQDFTLNLFSPEKVNEIETYCKGKILDKSNKPLNAFWAVKDVEKYISRRKDNMQFNNGELMDFVIDNDSFYELYHNKDTGESLFVSTKQLSYVYGHCLVGTVEYTRRLDKLWDITYLDKHDVITSKESVEIR